MNLYVVSPSNYELDCYVFETTRGKARLRVARCFGIEYTDTRSKLLKRGVNVPEPMVVDDTDSPGYDIVKKLGFGYAQGGCNDDWSF